MGACVSTDSEHIAAHVDAEKQLQQTKREISLQSKVLLLGGGDSGKSTILKQMRVINSLPFSPTERESYRQLVFSNLLQGMRKLLEAMKQLEMECIKQLERTRDVREGEPFPMHLLRPLQDLWNEREVQLGVVRGNQLAIPDNLTYFFPQLPRLFKPDYRPSEQDIIHCRAKTTGITETIFRIHHGNHTRQLHMIDVGGQKSERRKWIHCFEHVTAILFLVSLSGYDQCLVEDQESNQMQDAMGIWDSICHNQWFLSTSMILFLNKHDLFTEKLPKIDIKHTFPDYEGSPGDVTAGADYFKKRFLRLASKSKPTGSTRRIYPHFTNATSTPLIRVVMASVAEYVPSFLILNV